MMSDYNWFEGIPFPTKIYQKEILEDIRNKFVVKEEDLLILTYPKSGTNWLSEIVCLIQTKGDPKWNQTVPIWERSPWLEADIGYSAIINKEGPRLITSHLPIHLFSKSLFSSKAKAIYLIRNPRDILVSGYFFWRNKNVVKNPGSFGTYFEWFLKGNVIYGSWFEHVRGWLSMREWDNFLVLYYEDMKKDTKGTIKKICDFLGKKLGPDELDLVLKYSSFQAMKENRMSCLHLIKEDLVTIGLKLMRKVIYGSWFEHVRGWLSMREWENFLVLYYEDMKKDTKGTIKKICDFLGKKLGPDELDLVLKYSSFQAMKENNMSNFSLVKEDQITNGLKLMRKGTTGDWKNHFTVAQAEAFDKVYQEKMAGFPPGMFPWE